MKIVLLLQLFRLLSFVESDVIGALNGVIILPCSWTSGEIEVIHWKLGNKLVQSYYEKKEVFDHQFSSYKGRTSLFVDQIKNGNGSLQLKNLQKSDEGTYSCYLSATEIYETTVSLKVEAVVWGEQHKNVTIPCSFNPGEEVVVHWRIANDESRNVHSYYQDLDRFQNQDKSYKGRTSLIPSELAKGNASLQLRDLQKDDENTYSCYVGTSIKNKEDKVKLNVADFGHSMDYTLENDKLRLKCFASHEYPSDTVTIEWYEDDNLLKQKDINASSACTSCNSKQKSYKCVIKHSVVQSTWTGMWEPKAPHKDSVECARATCNMDKEMSVRLNVRRNGNVSEIPLDRISNLENLTANDNGDYLCEIRTTAGMCITITSVNITEQNERNQRLPWPISIPIIIFTVVCVVILLRTRKKKNPGTAEPAITRPLPSS